MCDVIKNTLNKDEHPYESFINSETRILIVGTIPPHRFCQSNKALGSNDVDWFYGSQQNKFWEIILSVFDKQVDEFQNISSRKQFAQDSHIGFIDLFHEVYRYRESASDSDIIPISFKNIFEYIERNNKIECVLFTSGYVETLAKRLLKEQKTVRVTKKGSGDFAAFILSNGRKVKWGKLKSPSPRQGTTIEKKKREWKEVFRGLD
tara:strand:- start:20073 stop:20690 length:618 start_codon:yes stop_codon:yes gene_type:complete